MAASAIPALGKLNAVQVQCGLIAVFLSAGTLFCVGRFVLRASMTTLYRVGLSAALAQQVLELRQALPADVKKGAAFSPGNLAYAVRSTGFPMLLVTAYLWLSSTVFGVELVALLLLAALRVNELLRVEGQLVKSSAYRQYLAGVFGQVEARRRLLQMAAAHLELWSLVMVVGGVVLLQGGRLLDVAFFVQYLVLRHCKSGAMVSAVGVWDGMVQGAMRDGRCPAVLRQMEVAVRGYLQQMRRGMAPLVGDEDKQH